MDAKWGRPIFCPESPVLSPFVLFCPPKFSLLSGLGWGRRFFFDKFGRFGGFLEPKRG